MEEKTIELITKLALQALEEQQNHTNGFMVPVGVSARHVHLTQEHVEARSVRGTLYIRKKI